jgi:GH35 family endo-1,4-beta-xylanase
MRFVVFAVVAGAHGVAAALTINATSASIQQVAGSGNLYVNGELAEYVNFSSPGTYSVVIRAKGSSAGGVAPLMGVSLDGVSTSVVSVSNSSTFADFSFSLNVLAGVHTLGASFQNDALIGSEDRNIYLQQIVITPPAGGIEPQLSTQSAWLGAGKAREDAAVAAAIAAIPALRKGTVSVKIVNASGAAVSGATVTAVQKTQDFLFGANAAAAFQFPNATQNTLYQQRFAELFNYATVPMSWFQVEAVQGVLNFTTPDAIVSWCQSKGIRVKGHTLLWADPEALPGWMNGVLPATSVQQQHVNDVMNHFGASVAAWDVVNEPSHNPSLGINLPYQWARNLAPNATLVVNDFNVMYNGNLPLFSLLQSAMASGVPFDAVGIQAHEPRDRAFPLDGVKSVLDLYASLGKRIHITEFTPVSSGIPVTGSPWRSVWTEAEQADYAVKFYQVCYGHPAVDAISWWDFCDAYAWNPGGGMLRSDLSAKPVYTALKNLIQTEWKTTTAVTTGPDGTCAISGFYGDYEVTVSSGSTTKVFSLDLAKDGATNITYSLGGTAVTAPATANATPIPVSFSGNTSGTVARLYVKKDSGLWVDTGLTATTPNGTFQFTGVTGNGTYYFDVTFGGGAAGTVDAQTVYTVPVVTPSVTVSTLATTDTTPLLSGTCQNAVSLSITVGSTTYTGIISAGTWSAQVTTALANGKFNITATATSSTGTTATDSTTNELTVDTTAPVITLNGSSSVSIPKGSTYTDAGATANDAIYGNVTSTMTLSSTVNTSIKGTYYVTYKAKDPLNNTATKKRTVKVI